MGTPAIRVEQLSKIYRIGAREQQPKTTAGTLKQAAMSPIAYLRRTLRPPREEEIFWALRDIGFEVQPGEVIGIIGRNGAGKSTLLKILSRITEPTSGRAVIKGRVGSLLEVGTGFHPELTGRDNIYLNGTILGMRRREIDRKFDEIVDFSGVEQFIDTPVKRYSSGMYVRLAFAVAAHLEPEILIIDEVLAVGDAEFQKKCLGKMSDVGKEGKTVLFVSHNMAAIQQLCNYGIVLSKGQLVYSGTALDAVDKYIDMSDRPTESDSDGFQDFNSVADRNYPAKIFKKIRILDKNNAPCETFPMLSSMRMEIVLEETHKYPKADYGVAISTPSGQRVTSFGTWMYPHVQQTIPEKIILDIPSLKYSPGAYRISLSCTYHSSGEWLDRIENAGSFHVVAIDIFNSGRLFTADYGLIAPEGEMILH
jgi:lipopolysaccharide transport system ATP-binding protein